MSNGLKQENVWEYPRPAVCEPFAGRLTVKHDGVIIAETTQAYRVLETSHPPAYYFPPQDVAPGVLKKGKGKTFCEWKGSASYFDLHVNQKITETVAWTYPSPTPEFEPIKDYISFYASRVDECYVNGERVIAQQGGFYGGWITKNLKGPFKGVPGSQGW